MTCLLEYRAKAGQDSTWCTKWFVVPSDTDDMAAFVSDQVRHLAAHLHSAITRDCECLSAVQPSSKFSSHRPRACQMRHRSLTGFHHPSATQMSYSGPQQPSQCYLQPQSEMQLRKQSYACACVSSSAHLWQTSSVTRRVAAALKMMQRKHCQLWLPLA